MVRVFGVGFSGNLATPGWGLGCVCSDKRFGRDPPFLAGVCGVCVWVRILPALCFFPALVFGPVASRVRRVRFRPPSGRAACGVGVCGGCRWWALPAPPLLIFCFFFLATGGGVVLGPVVAWLRGVRSCLSWSWVSWSPSPLPYWFGLRPCLFFFAARHFPSGVCASPSGVFFLPVGRCSWLGVVGFGRSVPRCSFRRGRGCCLRCCLAWGFARLLWCGCAALWLCLCLLFAPPLYFVCPFCLFPPFFLSCGRSACSSLCLPWAGARTGRHSVWLTGLLLVLGIGWAVPRPHGLGVLCTRLGWWPFLSGWVLALLAGRLRQAVS